MRNPHIDDLVKVFLESTEDDPAPSVEDIRQGLTAVLAVLAAEVRSIPPYLGDEGWDALERKAVEAGYEPETVRRRRRRDDFTTATIEGAYQYGFRQAAELVSSVTRPQPSAVDRG